MFDDLHIPIPADLTFVTSSIDFSSWWGMWKTHIFRKALSPLLQQIDPEYVSSEEEVLNLYMHLSESSIFHFTNSAHPDYSNKMVQNL